MFNHTNIGPKHRTRRTKTKPPKLFQGPETSTDFQHTQDISQTTPGLLLDIRHLCIDAICCAGQSHLDNPWIFASAHIKDLKRGTWEFKRNQGV